MITLTLLHPRQTTPLQHWTFDEESVIRVGRATDNNVILFSAVVSRRHVEIRRGDLTWELENLGANGTFLDDKPIAQVPVVDGMVISLARTGPKIQIRLVSEDIPPRLLIDRLEDATIDPLKSPEIETVTT